MQNIVINFVKKRYKAKSLVRDSPLGATMWVNTAFIICKTNAISICDYGVQKSQAEALTALNKLTIEIPYSDPDLFNKIARILKDVTSTNN